MSEMCKSDEETVTVAVKSLKYKCQEQQRYKSMWNPMYMLFNKRPHSIQYLMKNYSTNFGY